MIKFNYWVLRPVCMCAAWVWRPIGALFLTLGFVFMAMGEICYATAIDFSADYRRGGGGGGGDEDKQSWCEEAEAGPEVHCRPPKDVQHGSMGLYQQKHVR